MAAPAHRTLYYYGFVRFLLVLPTSFPLKAIKDYSTKTSSVFTQGRGKNLK